MKLKRLLYLILGCICFGCVGIALPILPTVPETMLQTPYTRAAHSKKRNAKFKDDKGVEKRIYDRRTIQKAVPDGI